MAGAVLALDSLRLPLKRKLSRSNNKVKMDTEYSYITLPVDNKSEDPLIKVFSENPSIALLARAKIA
ncbi:MAG: hypothetical protein F7B17_01880 [Desulfurococcales archaeon]|nr:hypothetical protein [Desulfurococcales archaeon]